MITLIRIRNQIDPTRDRETTEIAAEGLTLAELVKQYGDGLVHASVNGHVWASGLWPEVTPRDGDSIVLAPAVRGGGVLRTLATIAVIAAAAAVTGGVAGIGAAFAGTIGTSVAAGTAILAGAISIAGNLLISAFLGPSAPSTKSDTASYDPDGPKSLARSGTVIAKGYGTFRFGGNIVSSFADVEGLDQYLNVLMCAGWGPARAINNIQINGKDVGSYQNVQVTLRYGTNDQLPIPGFNRIINGYPQATKCLAGQPIVITGTGTLTEELQVDIQFPEGIFYLDSGNLASEVITYLVEYALSGTQNWQSPLIPYASRDIVTYDGAGRALNPPAWVVLATDLPASGGICYATSNGSHYPGEPWTGTISCEIFQPNGNHNTVDLPRSGSWQPFVPGTNLVQVTGWRQGYQDFVHNSNQALYNRTTIVGLTPGRYDVRVTKYGSAHLHDDVQFGDNGSPLVGQSMWVHSINEIQFSHLAYPNMILIGVRALATNQLSGQNVSVTAEIDFGLRSRDEGLMPAALLAFADDNPACVAADMLLDPLYGGGSFPGVTRQNLERFSDEWIAWAEMNDELVDDGAGNSIRRHVFNGVFDTEADLWSQVREVGQMSRAQLVPVGRDYGVSIDQLVDAPVQMFTVGNLLQDSFSETFLPLDDRANQVEIQFADRTRFYKSDNPIVYMDQAAQDAGSAIKNTRISARGVTFPAQAWHLARFKVRSNELLLRTGSFRADADAIACKYGSVVMLQHDVPSWGWGGRTLPGSTASLLLVDRTDLQFTAGKQYSVVVQHPSLQRFTGSVSAVATSVDPPGIILSLGGWTGLSRITRAVFLSGADCTVLSSAAGTVVVSPPPGFVPAAGLSVSLYDTDVLETAPVVSVDTAAGALTLSAPLSRVPEDYSTYIYGEAGSVKLVRVTGVKKASEFRSTIDWIDYDPALYTDAVPQLGGASAIATTQPGVTSLTGAETFELISGSYVGFASLSWLPGRDTAGVGVYALPEGHTGLPRLVARFVGITSFLAEQAPGTAVTYTVVGYDANDVYASHTASPSVTVATLGPASNLLLGSDFASGFTYWSVTPRAGDNFVPTLANDDEAVYTVAGSAITTSVPFGNQPIAAGKWAIGETLILSAYVRDSCVSASAPNAGVATINILAAAANGTIVRQAATLSLNGVTPATARLATAPFVVPAGTVQVVVDFGVGGASPSLPVGSQVVFSHFLLEIAAAGQTLPSPWADIDVQGQVRSVFTGGSSTGLRAQGSLLPSFTGSFAYTSWSSSITITWTGLVVLWPDGSINQIQAGTLSYSGLTASTNYWIWLYYDVLRGTVVAAPCTTPAGAPVLSAAYDSYPEAACKQDGRVALTPGGFEMATTAAGSGGSGGTTPPPGGGYSNPHPVDCTLRGTLLHTPDGLRSNVEIEQAFARHEEVYLMGRDGPERVREARWVTVRHWYMVSVAGMAPFGGSESLTLRPAGGEHRWCSRLSSGDRVEIAGGNYRPVTLRHIRAAAEVLHIELEGPSHEYLVGDGVWTHNVYKVQQASGA